MVKNITNKWTLKSNHLINVLAYLGGQMIHLEEKFGIRISTQFIAFKSNC